MSCIEAVILEEMHGRKLVVQKKNKREGRMGYCPFSALCHDREGCSPVATGSPWLRQGHAHGCTVLVTTEPCSARQEALVCAVVRVDEVLCRDKESLLRQDGDSVRTHGTARKIRARDTALPARDMGTRRARQDRARDPIGMLR